MKKKITSKNIISLKINSKTNLNITSLETQFTFIYIIITFNQYLQNQLQNKQEYHRTKGRPICRRGGEGVCFFCKKIISFQIKRKKNDFIFLQPNLYL